MEQLDTQTRESIKEQLRKYHGDPDTPEPQAIPAKEGLFVKLGYASRKTWWPTLGVALLWTALLAPTAIGSPWTENALAGGMMLTVIGFVALPRFMYLRRRECLHCGGDRADCEKRVWLEAPKQCMSEIGF